MGVNSSMSPPHATSTFPSGLLGFTATPSTKTKNRPPFGGSSSWPFPPAGSADPVLPFPCVMLQSTLPPPRNSPYPITPPRMRRHDAEAPAIPNDTIDSFERWGSSEIKKPESRQSSGREPREKLAASQLDRVALHLLC